MEAIAEDRGDTVLSRTVEVQIDVVDRSNKPPVWDRPVYGPIYVKENTAIGQTVTSVKARSVVSIVCLEHVFVSTGSDEHVLSCDDRK